MKKYLSFFILTMILSSCATHTVIRINLSDNEISELVIGKWNINITDEDKKLIAVDEYLPDGRVIQKGTLSFAGMKMNINAESTWKIENGKLISSLVSIEPEGMIPIGETFSDTVISIDKEKFVFIDGNTGERATYYRINK